MQTRSLFPFKVPACCLSYWRRCFIAQSSSRRGAGPGDSPPVHFATITRLISSVARTVDHFVWSLSRSRTCMSQASPLFPHSLTEFPLPPVPRYPTMCNVSHTLVHNWRTPLVATRKGKGRTFARARCWKGRAPVGIPLDTGSSSCRQSRSSAFMPATGQSEFAVAELRVGKLSAAQGNSAGPFLALAAARAVACASCAASSVLASVSCETDASFHPCCKLQRRSTRWTSAAAAAPRRCHRRPRLRAPQQGEPVRHPSFG